MRIDLSVGYAKDRKPLLLNDLTKAKPESYDLITGYSWGSGALNDRETASRLKLGLALTRLQDGLLGTFHEFVVGGEYETTKAASSTWKADNLIYNYVDGSPYTYGRTISPVSGEDVGWGLVGFYIAPPVRPLRSDLRSVLQGLCRQFGERQSGQYAHRSRPGL